MVVSLGLPIVNRISVNTGIILDNSIMTLASGDSSMVSRTFVIVSLP